MYYLLFLIAHSPHQLAVKVEVEMALSQQIHNNSNNNNSNNKGALNLVVS